MEITNQADRQPGGDDKGSQGNRGMTDTDNDDNA